MIGVLLGVPVDLSRDGAREAARAELAKPEYVQAEPGVLRRVVDWVSDRLGDLLHTAEGASPGGALGWLLVLVVLGAVVAAVLVRAGGVRRGTTTEAALFLGPRRTAATYREQAERHAAAGEWAEAVRDRLRAIAAGLEERGVLEFRPGRTADEIAAEAGTALPAAAADLRQAALLFDEIWYGGRPATEESYARMRQVDTLVSERRIRPAGAPA